MKNDIRDTFTRFRKALNEAEEQQGEWYNPKQNGVPYTQQDELLQSIMQTAKQQFGADFTNIKTPMYYYKDDGDVSFFCANKYFPALLSFTHPNVQAPSQ